MSRDRIPNKVRKDKPDGRAKHSRITINGKRVDYPLKAAGVSAGTQSENAIAKEQVERKVVNEIGVKFTPKRLRDIMGDGNEHQNVKNSIENLLSDIGDSGINIAYPYFVNERAPNESESAFKPFPAPTERMIEKLFDLFDLEGIDVLVSPVGLDNSSEMQWVKIAAPIYAKRKPDFLNEYALSGMIPYAVSEETAKQMAKLYLDNGFESLTFDLGGARVRQSRMRGIIDSIPNWNELLIHGTSVPHFNWHGTHNTDVQPTYDLLVSVYGFDSFGGVRRGFNSEVEQASRIPGKMSKKRFYTCDTYGAYTLHGLKKLMENHSLSCQCPICGGFGSPIEIYNRSSTNEELKALGEDLKVHRWHAAHKEMSKVASLIDRGKYLDYVADKKAASKELQAIVNAIGNQTTSDDF